MTSAGTEWTTTVPLTSLERSRRYTLYGWTKDNGWSAGEVSFTLEEISKLKPGEILYWAGQPGSDRNATTNSHTDFQDGHLQERRVNDRCGSADSHSLASEDILGVGHTQ